MNKKLNINIYKFVLEDAGDSGRTNEQTGSSVTSTGRRCVKSINFLALIIQLASSKVLYIGVHCPTKCTTIST
jgi:hypothetical protein